MKKLLIMAIAFFVVAVAAINVVNYGDSINEWQTSLTPEDITNLSKIKNKIVKAKYGDLFVTKSEGIFYITAANRSLIRYKGCQECKEGTIYSDDWSLKNISKVIYKDEAEYPIYSAKYLLQNVPTK